MTLVLHAAWGSKHAARRHRHAQTAGSSCMLVEDLRQHECCMPAVWLAADLMLRPCQSPSCKGSVDMAQGLRSEQHKAC